ncbi:MAG: 23S rRNA (uracil(1939)-C(5))-methyltransferase RlmD [Colwellia sp.]|nr:23S rRNA (uracil(1939)-C(5))-methyltransferase RlmD [Colwellia sp.]
MANFFKATTKKPVQTQLKQRLMVKIDKLDLNGCGVAYYKQKPIFINGSLPNEKVEIQLVEQKNKYARAKLLTINKTSENRVPPKCQHFSLCGGCDLQHLDYNEQLNFKKNKVIELFSRSGITTTIIEQLPWQQPIVSLPWHYRRKARIGVQFDKNAQATIGFRQRATNQLVAVKSCPVLVKPADDVFPLLKELIAKLSVKKAIGHIEVISVATAEQPSNQLTLIVRQIRAINEQDRKLWQEYANRHQWQLYFQDEAVKPKENKRSTSIDNNLHYNLVDDIVINFSITDFIQINQQVNVGMVEQALDWLQLKPEDHVLDLFCGLGNFSLPLAKRVTGVIGVEGVQSMVDKATANATFNHINNCQFFQADLNSEWSSNKGVNKELNHWAEAQFTKVLLDPARAGAELAIAQIVKLAIPTVLYVSCEPTTLARDSQLLLSKGYKIEKIGLIDMFSQTKHVETMVLFSK